MPSQIESEYSLLVSHHMSEIDERNGDVSKLMESFGEWIEVEPSIYVLWSKLPRSDVMEGIRRVVNKRDKLAVIDLAGRFAGPDGLLALATH